MLPRSLLHLLAGAALCSAQYNYYPQNLPYQPQYQPPQPPQAPYSNIWQPQYDPQSFRLPQPQQYQQQFQQAQPQQFQQQAPPPQQYQNQAPPPQGQYNQNPPVYQPQFQPQQPFQPQPQFQTQPQFQPQQQQFQPAPQQNYAPQPQFQQQQQPIYHQGNQSPPQLQQQPRPAPPKSYQQPAPAYPQQVYREQPVIFEQIVKIPPPTQQRPPPQSTAQIIQIAAPPPPEKFVPYIADIYTGPSDAKPPVITVITPDESLPSGTYIAEEIIVDGNHPSYIENIEKLQPVKPLPPPRKATVQQNSFVPSPQAKLKAPEISQIPQQNIRPQQPPPAPRPAAQARPPPPSTPASAKVTKAIPSAASGEKTPNGVFLSCCKKQKVAKSCERICNFDILSKKTLTGMFLGTDPCPQSHGLDLLQCAAQHDDHTQCCIENDVHKTTAGNKCLGFCNMKPGVSFQADVSMLPCWGVLNDIKECFKEHIEDGLAG